MKLPSFRWIALLSSSTTILVAEGKLGGEVIAGRDGGGDAAHPMTRFLGEFSTGEKLAEIVSAKAEEPDQKEEEDGKQAILTLPPTDPATEPLTYDSTYFTPASPLDDFKNVRPIIRA